MNWWLRIMLFCCLLLPLSVVPSEARDHNGQESPNKVGSNTIAPPVSLRCPKCQGQMEQGWILQDGGSVDPQTTNKWVQGRVKRIWGKWTGVVVKVSHEIAAFRCSTCGYVEMYAK
jgi:predicted nucleic-acid-binding Zn-ribbon protein